MGGTKSVSTSLQRRYESLLWGSMDLLGVTESVERKVGAAVGIQFAVTVTIFALAVLLSHGPLFYTLAAVLFVAAVVAFVNTLLIVRRDLTGPLLALESSTDRIAAGDLDVTVEPSDQPDEVGSLTNAFAEMQGSLRTVAAQADALARQEFDDPALAETVPGEFGRSLDRMAESLEAYTRELESRSTQLEALVDTFSEAADRARNGDLTATIDADEGAIADERYRDLAENYNDLVRTLDGTIADVKGFARVVDDASTQLRTGMTEVDDASDEVARSVQEISDGAARQTEDLQAVVAEMNTLSATVEEIAASGESAADMAERTAERGRIGAAAAEEALTELDEFEARIEQTATAVDALAEEVAEIDTVVSFIDGLAEETNLLALNASVEAARAGRSGEGFAVVADEVKGLAEETKASAGRISARIEAVQEASERTRADVEAMETTVAESIDTIGTALTEFEDIVESVETVNTTIQEISDATDGQAHTTQDVVAMVDEVAAISEETAAEAETVAAATEEQTATVSTVTASARELSERSDDLRSLLDDFTVGAASGGGGGELPNDEVGDAPVDRVEPTR